MSIPILDLKLAEDPIRRSELLRELQNALLNVGFLYIINHGVDERTILDVADRLPALFDLDPVAKQRMSKANSPHFLGYSAFAEEITQGKQDLREQYDFATELPTIAEEGEMGKRDSEKLYWKLRGPNQWPHEQDLPGFKDSLTKYHDALSLLATRFVHLIEEAFKIPVGTFDSFFENGDSRQSGFLRPQHRIKLVKYHIADDEEGQGVGPHKDSSGWLTFLYQVGNERGLEVLGDGWIPANPIPGSFVVNFGNAFEAATNGAVRATIHRVKAPTERVRYSIPFFMGLPLDLKVSEIRKMMPPEVKSPGHRAGTSADDMAISSFLDPRWDNLGESQLRKWIRSHPEVALKWYGLDTVAYYTQ